MDQRQLVAIMFTDLVGYSALTHRDETLALAVLEKHWELLRPVFARFGGHEIKTTGDGFMLEFPSALRAVEAGLAMQEALLDYNDTVDADHAIHVRIGIHLGDIERRNEDVYGDGVNIAARLESLAAPGGLCISESVYSSVQNKIDTRFYSMGEQKLKNISHPVVAYSNHLQHKPGKSKTKKSSNPSRFPKKTTVVLLFIIVVLLITDDESPAPPVTETAKKVEPVAVADLKSVAVLPFANRSDEKKDAYFADGLHDDLLTHLSKLSDMKVISRTSVMGYRNTQKKMKTIGAELGVATLLEGSVQRAGNQVRINVQLINANTDEHIWAEIFDRELTAANIFAIQSEIATAIAKALRSTLSADEQERIAAVPTENLAAYEAYLLGKQRMVTRTSKELAEAVDYFEQAITHDPTFALAYVGLSDATQLQFLYSGLPREEMTVKAEMAINKALELDDQSGEAYASLGLLKLERKDYDGAEIAFKKALALNPNYATSYHWYGSLLTDLGQDKEAMEQMQKALALDPLSIVINTNVATFLAASGKFDEAMAHFDKIIEIDPTAAQGYLGKARLHWSVYGRLDEAEPFARKALSLDPDSPQYHALLGGLYLTLGDDKRAECVSNLAMRFGPDSLFPNIMMAYIHASRNEHKQTLSYARKSHKMEPNKGDVLLFIRDNYLRDGKYDKARSLYEESNPELLNEDEPVINKKNYRNAIDLAYVLQLIGEKDRADRLLERSLAFIRSGIQRLDFDGYKINDVRIYALQGEKQQALNALRQAIDEGWRDGWWYFLEIDPGLGSIRTEPEFQAMLQEIKTDMAEQLARVKENENEEEVCART